MAIKISSSKLNKAQEAFCREYVINNQNGTKAYMKAYGEEMSEDSARANASRMLIKDNIKKYVQALKGKVSQKFEITAEKLLKELEDIKQRNLSKDDRISITSIQEQAKMCGLYAPEKKEVKSDVVWKEEKTYEN